MERNMLLLRHHPDKGGDTKFCQVINEMYEVISEHFQNKKTFEDEYVAASGDMRSKSTTDAEWTEEECRCNAHMSREEFDEFLQRKKEEEEFVARMRLKETLARKAYERTLNEVDREEYERQKRMSEWYAILIDLENKRKRNVSAPSMNDRIPKKNRERSQPPPPPPQPNANTNFIWNSFGATSASGTRSQPSQANAKENINRTSHVGPKYAFGTNDPERAQSKLRQILSPVGDSDVAKSSLHEEEEPFCDDDDDEESMSLPRNRNAARGNNRVFFDESDDDSQGNDLQLLAGLAESPHKHSPSFGYIVTIPRTSSGFMIRVSATKGFCTKYSTCFICYTPSKDGSITKVQEQHPFRNSGDLIMAINGRSCLDVPYEKVKKLLQAAPQELVLWMLEVQPAANEVCSEPPSNQSPKAPSREKVLDQSELPSQDSELDSQDDSSDNSESSNKSDKSNHPPNDDAMEGNESPNDGNEDGNQSPNDGSCENNVKETEAAENEVFIFVRKQVRDVLSESKKKNAFI
jgi:hypothetical protein